MESQQAMDDPDDREAPLAEEAAPDDDCRARKWSLSALPSPAGDERVAMSITLSA
jgi:hypothetical protein